MMVTQGHPKRPPSHFEQEGDEVESFVASERGTGELSAGVKDSAKDTRRRSGLRSCRG